MAKLLIVGLPIGNLQDITLRALEALKTSDVIACEDTRVTGKLLHLLKLEKKKLIAYHNFNEANSADGIIKLIQSGKSVALVSDAGMPLVSDPGFLLVKKMQALNLPFEVIPGPSAVTMTFALAALSNTYTFLGFLKPKPGQRQNQLKVLAPGMYITFVAVHKLLATLDDLILVFGPELEVFLGRELTKLHESHYRGSVSEVKNAVQNHLHGEFTLAFLITGQ